MLCSLSRRFRTFSFLALGFATLSKHATAQMDGVQGNWIEPTGSIIRIESCGQSLCARLIKVSGQAPSEFDIYNPVVARRKQPLCGLLVGQGFHLDGPDKAEGGYLYDPKSGKTYHGAMARHGARLELRGYVGIKLFGRSETWTQASATVPACNTK